MSLFNLLIIGSYLVGAIICITSYKFQISKKRVLIPSSYLLTKFPTKTNSGSNNFPPRLFIELLILLFICLALYFFNQESVEQKTLLVIDSSLSMSAKNATGESNLEVAKNLALRELDSSASYKLISLPLEIISEKKDSSEFDKYLEIDAIAKQIKAINQTSLPDLISNDLTEIISKSDATKIIIYTDKNINIFTESINSNKKIEIRSNPFQVQNAYISEIIESTKNDLVELDVKIGFSGKGSSNIIVTLESLNQPKKLISSKNTAIFAGRQSSVNFNFKPGKEHYLITISKSLHTDAIELDNSAYWVNANKSEGEINLYTTEKDKMVASNSLSNATNRKVNFIESNGSVTNQNNNKNNNFNVFYKTTLPPQFDNDSLIILPSNSEDYLEIDRINPDTKITSWDQSSPLTKYINFETFSLNQTLIFKPNNWSNSIINSNEGSILLFGIKDSKRVIVVGFELFPFDKTKRSSADILLLNLLSEIATNKATISNNLIRFDSGNNAVCLIGEPNCNQANTFLRSGIYQTQNKEHELFVVNNLNSEESETFNVHEEIIKLNNDKNDLIDESNVIKLPKILYLALILLVVDILVVIFLRSELNWKGKLS